MMMNLINQRAFEILHAKIIITPVYFLSVTTKVSTGSFLLSQLLQTLVAIIQVIYQSRVVGPPIKIIVQIIFEETIKCTERGRGWLPQSCKTVNLGGCKSNEKCWWESWPPIASHLIVSTGTVLRETIKEMFKINLSINFFM